MNTVTLVFIGFLSIAGALRVPQCTVTEWKNSVPCYHGLQFQSRQVISGAEFCPNLVRYIKCNDQEPKQFLPINDNVDYYDPSGKLIKKSSIFKSGRATMFII